jgi:hypothetical protein
MKMNLFGKTKEQGWTGIANELVSLALKVIKHQDGVLKLKESGLEHDRICGHWMGQNVSRTATIIKTDSGYLISFFVCGKLGEQLSAVSKGEIIHIERFQTQTKDLVYFSGDSRYLVIDGYGRFIRDHETGYDFHPHTLNDTLKEQDELELIFNN